MFKKWVRDHPNDVITKDMFVGALDDEEKVFRLLEQSPVWRGFPVKNILYEAASVLRRVLTERCIPRDLTDVGIKECFQMGWLRSEATNYEAADIVCFYPSPLHYKSVGIYLVIIRRHAHVL